MYPELREDEVREISGLVKEYNEQRRVERRGARGNPVNSTSPL
jgi:hypothetical protein